MLPAPALKAILALTNTLLELILIGIVVAWGWALLRLSRGRRLLPAPFGTLPRPEWGLGTFLAVLLLFLGSSLAAIEIGRDFLGVKVEAVLRRPEPKPESDAGEPTAEARREEIRLKADSARQAMLVNAVDKGIFLICFPWIFRRVSGSVPKRLGFVAERWPEQIQVGFIAMLLSVPVVHAIFFLARTFYPTNAHPIEQMLQVPFDSRLAVLALLSTIVLAPLEEEILFRGVLQSWLTRLVSMRGRRSMSSLAADGEAADEEPHEAANPVCWPAVVASSAIFALMHAPQWPAPIPLFAFSMVLGAVYQKTGSLWTSIALHGSFNGLSTLFMLSNQLGISLSPPAPAIEAFLSVLTPEVLG